MPDIAGSWPEEGTQYVPGAPMEPVQQPYQPQQYTQQQYQQPYPEQGYPDQQYAQQQYPQQQYAQQQQPYQEQPIPQQAMYAEEEQAAVPSEFDHLFRDSSPENRKSISGKAPVVSGPGAAPGFQQQSAPAQQQQQQAAQATAVYAPAQQQPGSLFEDRKASDYSPQQPFGGGYGTPGGPGSGAGGGNRRAPLIIGAAVVVVAALGLYLGLSGGGGGGNGNSPAAGTSTAATHASTETAQQQAAAVYQLVQQSKQLRSDINAEVGSLDSCSNVSGLQARITDTAQSRQAQADQVAKLDVSKISGGAALVSALNSAWSDSASSDADFAKTAGDVAGSCSKSAVRNDPNYAAAGQGSNQATQEKSSAVKLWNQTMTNYGQPEISQGDL
ncbi:MAG TPA: hypothetical protein VH372_07310 [Actinospica sp.]|jgi:hypothetical protein|nr:hypothetical protein [Actinospica sp.]